jgi:hypothetical protein
VLIEPHRTDGRRGDGAVALIRRAWRVRLVVIVTVLASAALVACGPTQPSMPPSAQEAAIALAYAEASSLSSTEPVVDDVVAGRAGDVCPVGLCADPTREVILVSFDITMDGSPFLVHVILDKSTGSVHATSIAPR